MGTIDKILDEISRLYQSVKKLKDKDEKEQRLLKKRIDILTTKNQVLEQTQSNLQESITNQDNVISKLQAQVKQRTEQMQSYKSQVPILQAEINSLKLKSATKTVHHNHNHNHDQQTSTPSNYNSYHIHNYSQQQQANKPFIRHITWSQRNDLKIGDKVDYR